MHGSLQDVNINGVSFQVVSDVDANITLNRYENEMVPNGAGPASMKSVIRVPGASNINLRVNATELGFLRTWADSGELVKFFMVTRDGSVLSALVLLRLDEVSTANGSIMINVQCQTDWDIQSA